MFVYIHKNLVDEPDIISMPSVPQIAHPNGTSAGADPCNHVTMKVKKKETSAHVYNPVKHIKRPTEANVL